MPFKTHLASLPDGNRLRGESEQLAQTDRGKDIPAIVNQSAHESGRERNSLRTRIAHNFENVSDGETKQGLPNPHGTHFQQVRSWKVLGRAQRPRSFSSQSHATVSGWVSTMEFQSETPCCDAWEVNGNGAMAARSTMPVT